MTDLVDKALLECKGTWKTPPGADGISPDQKTLKVSHTVDQNVIHNCSVNEGTNIQVLIRVRSEYHFFWFFTGMLVESYVSTETLWEKMSAIKFELENKFTNNK